MKQSHLFAVPISEEDFQVPGIHQGATHIVVNERDSIPVFGFPAGVPQP